MLKKISLPCEYIWLLNSELPAKRTAKCLRTVPRDQVDEGELQRTKRAGLQTLPDTGRGSRKRAPRWPTPGPASAGTSRQEKPGWEHHQDSNCSCSTRIPCSCPSRLLSPDGAVLGRSAGSRTGPILHCPAHEQPAWARLTRVPWAGSTLWSHGDL